MEHSSAADSRLPDGFEDVELLDLTVADGEEEFKLDQSHEQAAMKRSVVHGAGEPPQGAEEVMGQSNEDNQYEQKSIADLKPRVNTVVMPEFSEKLSPDANAQAGLTDQKNDI